VCSTFYFVGGLMDKRRADGAWVAMRGTVMLLFYATPIVFGFANLVLPLQIEAPDVAFPRLNRHLGPHTFDPANGGVLLWQCMFWFFGHPEVYIIALPFFGIITEVIPVSSRKTAKSLKNNRVTNHRRSSDWPFQAAKYGHCTDAGMQRKMLRGRQSQAGTPASRRSSAPVCACCTLVSAQRVQHVLICPIDLAFTVVAAREPSVITACRMTAAALSAADDCGAVRQLRSGSCRLSWPHRRLVSRIVDRAAVFVRG